MPHIAAIIDSYIYMYFSYYFHVLKLKYSKMEKFKTAAEAEQAAWEMAKKLAKDAENKKIKSMDPDLSAAYAINCIAVALNNAQSSYLLIELFKALIPSYLQRVEA